MSVSEAADFAAEFTEGGGDKRHYGGRKSSVSVWISASDLPFTQTNKKLFSKSGKVLQYFHGKIPREI